MGSRMWIMSCRRNCVRLSGNKISFICLLLRSDLGLLARANDICQKAKRTRNACQVRQTMYRHGAKNDCVLIKIGIERTWKCTGSGNFEDQLVFVSQGLNCQGSRAKRMLDRESVSSAAGGGLALCHLTPPHYRMV